MTRQPGIGEALAELVRRLTPEEKREFARAFSWEELEALRRQGQKGAEEQGSGGEFSSAPLHPSTSAPRRVGEPRLYVAAVSEGLALELPVKCIAAFLERLPTILAVSLVEVYLRRDGRGEEYQVNAKEFADFLDAHQDVLVEGSLMIELGSATLVSGGGGCLYLALEGVPGEVRRRLATEALQACGFDHQFVGDSFRATVWDDELEVSDR